MNCLNSRLLRARSGRSRGFRAGARRAARGFIHLFFLVLVTLGIGIWGVSEWVLRVTDIEQAGDAERSESLHEARRALMEYALTSPPRLRVENRSGRFSALAFQDDAAQESPYRYFSLPCPDVGTDGNWDGVSDILHPGMVDGNPSDIALTPCGADSLGEGADAVSGYAPNIRGARSGRFPWRTFNGQSGGYFAYIHGAGDRDLKDDFGGRLWYAAARNMTRADRAINLHWQMRQTDGWLRLANLAAAGASAADVCGPVPAVCAGADVALAADIDEADFGRVAAVAIAPGIFGPFNSGARAPESASITASVAASPNAHRAYLEETTFAGLAGSVLVTLAAFNYTNHTLSPLILYDTAARGGGADAISYFTIDDLAAEGDRLFTDDGGGAIADLLEGRDGHFGVREMMRAHLKRYGYLPGPAAFGRSAAVEKSRPAGVGPATLIVGDAEVAGVRAGIVGPATVSGAVTMHLTVTAFLPVRNIGRVYLQEGTQLAGINLNVYGGDHLPPYNLALYALDSSFNRNPMRADVRTALGTGGIYPSVNVFGFRQRDGDVSVALDSPAVRETSAPLAPLDSRVYMASPPPMRDIDFFSPQSPAPGATISVALAEPALAYIASTTGLGGMVALADGDATAAMETPPFGMQVKLPPGTRFALRAPADDPVSLFLPHLADVQAEYDRDTGRYRLSRAISEPAIVRDSSDRFITITAVLNSLAADAANAGFLPAADAAIRHLDVNSILSLGASITIGADVFAHGLPGFDATDSESAFGAGGVLLPYRHAVSRLPIDLRLYTNARLAITPFPPAGRPAAAGTEAAVLDLGANADGGSSIPSPLFINFMNTGNLQGPTSSEFTLPAGTRIFYPQDAEIALGENFAFPPATRALLPPGTVMTVDVIAQSFLPDGFQEPDDSVSRLNARTVTLVHGGVMELSGPAADADGSLTLYEGARIVAEEGFGVGYSQELFDIELRTPFRVAGVGGGETFAGAAVLQPLTGRLLSEAIAPIPLTAAGLTVRLNTWTRARFLTRARNLPLRGSLGDYEIVQISDIDGATPATTTITVTAAAVDNIPMPGGRIVPSLTLFARQGTSNVGGGAGSFRSRINEQAEFMLPPGAHDIDSWFGANTTFILSSSPESPVGFYHPQYEKERRVFTVDEGLADGRWGMLGTESEPFALTLSLVTEAPRGPAVHQFVLILDADAALSNGRVLPAGTIIDAVNRVAWPPGSLWTLPGAAPDLAATSGRQMYLYFPDGVTLTNRADVVFRGGGLPGVLAGDFAIPPGTTITNVANTTLLLTRTDDNALPARLDPAPDRVPVRLMISDSYNGVNVAPIYRAEDDRYVNDSLALPPRTFVVLPAGRSLRFLPPAAHDETVDADDAEYVFLPPDAVAVLPPGSDVELSDSANVAIVSSTDENQNPPILRLGGVDRGLAIVAHRSLMRTAPIVIYEDDAFLFDADAPSGERDNVVSRIVAGTRGDLFGNITRRDGLSFPLDLLPSDTAEFLRNFPMTYAVAQDCRAGYADDGENCAEEPGEGLEFAVAAGEEIVLQERLLPPSGNVYITLHSEFADGLRFSQTSQSFGGFHGIAPGAVTSSLCDYAWLTPDGEYTPIEGIDECGGYLQESHDVFFLGVPDDAPADAELRVYVGIENLSAVRTNPSLLDDVHYAAVPSITIFSGGFLGENPAAASFQFTISQAMVALPDAAGSLSLSNFRLGFGAQVGGEEERPPMFPFGQGGVIAQQFADASGTAFTASVRLDDYALVNRDGSFRFGVDAASRFANLDSAGQVVFEADPGDRLLYSGGGVHALAGSGPTAAREPSIMLNTGGSIPMEQGYLWQGYINPPASGQGVSLNFSANVLRGDLTDEVYLRVHPTDELLNFWGSGLERAEGMDNRSIARRDPVDMTDVFTFRFDDWTSPERDAPPKRRVRTRVDGTVIRDGSNQISPRNDNAVGPGWPAAMVWFHTADVAGGESNEGRYVHNRLWKYGWRSPLLNNGAMRVRVRDAATGEIVGVTDNARWVPVSRSRRMRDQTRNTGYVVWGGPNAAPFNVPDQAYMSNVVEFWAHRQMVAVEADTVESIRPGGTQVPINERGNRARARLVNTDSYIEAVVTVGGAEMTVTAVFNMPPFQLRGRALRPSPAWVYDMKAADVRAPTETDPCDARRRSYSLPLGAPLGHHYQTQRANYDNCDIINGGPGAMRAAAFSGRHRRESRGDPHFPGISGPDVTIGLSSAGVDGGTRGLTPIDPGPLANSLTIVRVQMPQTRVSLPDPLPPGFEPEVRAAGDPRAFNPTFGDPNLVSEGNPTSYTIPGDRIFSTVIAQQGEPSGVSQVDMRVTLRNLTLSSSLFDGAAFYMDRAYNIGAEIPPVLGIPRRRLQLGNAFRITGPGAIVPHFGGRRIDSTADAYAARARLFYGVFAGDSDGEPDNDGSDNANFKLHNIYSAGGYACPDTPDFVSGADDTCPQMQDPLNARYWVPIVAGAMAFEGVDVNITSAADDAVAVVLPQPQAEVQDSGGSMRTIYAGSIIYPRSGLVIPATRITASANLILPDGAAAAVDVSPAASPVPIRRIRVNAQMHAWDMNMAPARSGYNSNYHANNTVPPHPVGNYIIEPLQFAQSQLVDFSDFRVNDDNVGYKQPGWSTDRQDPTPLDPGRPNPGLDFSGDSATPDFRQPRGCFHVLQGTRNRGNPAGRVGECRFADYAGPIPLLGILPDVDGAGPGAITHMDFDVPSTRSDITLRYDGTATRGFLGNGRIVSVMAAYYRGDDVFTQEHGFTTWFPRRGYGGNAGAFTDDNRSTNLKLGTWGNQPDRPGDPDDYNNPVGNYGAQIGNPFSWHWMHRGLQGVHSLAVANEEDGASFVPMGMARQFSVPYYYGDPMDFYANGTLPIPSPGAIYVAGGIFTRHAGAVPINHGFNYPDIDMGVAPVDYSLISGIDRAPYVTLDIDGNIVPISGRPNPYSWQCGYADRKRYPQSFPNYPRTRSVFFADVPCLGAVETRSDFVGLANRNVEGAHAPESNIQIDDDRADANQHISRTTNNRIGEPYLFSNYVNDNRPDEAFDNRRSYGAYAPAGYYWVGVLSGSTGTGSAKTSVTVRGDLVEREDDEFLALRLPHLIEIPPDSEVGLFPHRGDFMYPVSADQFFEFPPDSVANILQADAASWESVHPYVSRYLPGAVLASDGGVYSPGPLDPARDAGAAAESTRRLLEGAEQMIVQEDNDGHRRVDIGGRRVMHYAKTEVAPGNYSHSNADVHTNVWIRLPRGGVLDYGDMAINLPPDTVVNPILGTYLPGPLDDSTTPPVRTNYQAPAEVILREDFANPAAPREFDEMIVARPAFILPEGATMRIGAAGARVENVKAAAIFSLSPLDGVSCPHGMVDNNFPRDGLNGTTVEISQTREGVSESETPAIDESGVVFTLGHPCAWLDDAENMDGDRFFVYRSRRRYAGEHRARTLSNDRTYLLGGRLVLS